MTQLIEFRCDDGGIILVEIEADAGLDWRHPGQGEDAGAIPAARSLSGAIRQAQLSFEEALDRVQPIATGLRAKLSALHNPPHEIEVEFGLNMSIEGGVVVARGGVGANFRVRLTWQQEESGHRGR